jgi:Flp pilus assembly protein TadG
MKADMTRERTGASFLTRLSRDAAGNTIALAAAAMIPLAGLIGGGVDMSRLYLTKTRLQHACDAGALAGRKVMGAGAWTTGGTTSAQARANELFATNFKANAYGTGTLSRSYTESNGTVTGNVSVAVPMTIMRVFGMTSRNLAVTCTAKMEIPNTDVMFVLDVTGSMNCVAGDSGCSNNGNVPAVGAKITGLKSAVKCFYEALLKVNTAEVCGNDPSATSYTGTAQIRMGFMPYSVNVNVGKLLPNDALANSWAYQSRQANFTSQPVYTANTPTVNGPYWETYSALSTQPRYRRAAPSPPRPLLRPSRTMAPRLRAAATVNGAGPAHPTPAVTIAVAVASAPIPPRLTRRPAPRRSSATGPTSRSRST